MNLSLEEIKSILTKIANGPLLSHLAGSNIKALMDLIVNSLDNNEFESISYKSGDEIVSEGTITLKTLNNDFRYAYVPLGFILEGEVIVHKAGKATKKLVAGDFIGLFETCDWLSTQQRREIGHWTLIAHANVKILYFSAKVLDLPEAKNFCNYLLDITRADKVPQPITDLPLLDWVASHTTNGRLKGYAIIAHTHLLPNNFPFLRHLAYLVEFDNMFILEKPYSTVGKTLNDLVQSGCEVIQVRMEPGFPYEFSVQKSIEILWTKILEQQKRSDFKKILIIDDGGDIWHSIPWDRLSDITIAGVEQTQRGITRIAGGQLKIPPVISVASSGIKKIVESIFIGKSVVKKLEELATLSKNPEVGILGMGSIGTTIVDCLNELNIQVSFYDPNDNNIHDKATKEPSLDSLINKCDLIIGTTGGDALKGIPYERINGHKVFVSASSADVEFASLLKLASPTNEPFGMRRIEIHDNLVIDILNGGYPINFDRQKDATASENIVLTRCLMYIGAMQAVELVETGKMQSALYNLDVISQRKLLERWIEDKKSSDEVSPVNKNDIEQIINHTSFTGALNMPSVWKK